MGQLIVALIVTVAVVSFGVSNGHHVVMSPVVGEPIRIRLFFLLSIFYIAGGMTTFFYSMFARLNRRADRSVARRELAPDESDR